MSAKTFPIFREHDEASCFNCGGDFGPAYPMASGFPVGQGQWAQDCCKCGMTTFYDLEVKITNESGYIVDRCVRDSYDRIISRGGLSGLRSAEAFLRLVERYAARGVRLV